MRSADHIGDSPTSGAGLPDTSRARALIRMVGAGESTCGCVSFAAAAAPLQLATRARTSRAHGARAVVTGCSQREQSTQLSRERSVQYAQARQLLIRSGREQPARATSSAPLAGAALTCGRLSICSDRETIDGSNPERRHVQHQSRPTLTAAKQNLGVQARIVNTDGLGVVLRSAPSISARMPTGFHGRHPTDGSSAT